MSLAMLQQELGDYQDGAKRYQRAVSDWQSSSVMNGDRPMMIKGGGDSYQVVNFDSSGNGTLGGAYTLAPNQQVEHYGGSTPDLFYVRQTQAQTTSSGTDADGNPVTTTAYDFSGLPARPNPDDRPKAPDFTMAQANQLRTGTPSDDEQMISQEMMTAADKEDQMGILQKVLSNKL